MEQAAPVGVGIDVSKNKLDIVLRRDQGDEHHFIVANSRPGTGKLIRALNRCACPVVMESTGRFHILCALLLHEAGFDVRVINPIIAHRYVTASIRKKKMDKADAAVLAHVAAMEKDIPRFTATKLDIHVRQKIGLLCSLERQLQALRATRERYLEFQKVIGLSASRAERQLRKIVRLLGEQMEDLRNEVEQMVSDIPDMRSRSALACTVPGISPYLATILCHTLRTDCVSPKQWIHYVGLDVSVHQSGTWKGHGKLSKRGSGYLRKRLFGAAWGAMQHNPHFRRYYDSLRGEGRSYREGINIIARKILCILFGVLKSGQPFSEERLVASLEKVLATAAPITATPAMLPA